MFTYWRQRSSVELAGPQCIANHGAANTVDHTKICFWLPLFSDEQFAVHQIGASVRRVKITGSGQMFFLAAFKVFSIFLVQIVCFTKSFEQNGNHSVLMMLYVMARYSKHHNAWDKASQLKIDCNIQTRLCNQPLISLLDRKRFYLCLPSLKLYVTIYFQNKTILEKDSGKWTVIHVAVVREGFRYKFAI